VERGKGGKSRSARRSSASTSPTASSNDSISGSVGASLAAYSSAICRASVNDRSLGLAGAVMTMAAPEILLERGSARKLTSPGTRYPKNHTAENAEGRRMAALSRASGFGLRLLRWRRLALAVGSCHRSTNAGEQLFGSIGVLSGGIQLEVLVESFRGTFGCNHLVALGRGLG